MHLHPHRVAQVRAGELADLAGHRRREEQRLPDLRDALEDAGELGLEPHVEHPVRLVEHEDLEPVELRGPLLEVVDEPPRRRDDHLVLLERARLLAHADAADDERAADVAALAEPVELTLDLDRELARRREHEGARPGAAGVRGQPLDDGQEERGGLAGARRGRADHVLARERGGDGLGLDGRRVLEARALERVERLL